MRMGKAAVTNRDLLPRTWRTILFAGLTTISLFGAAGPRQDKTNWDNLKQLAPNEQIRIVLNAAKSYRGGFPSVSDEVIVVRLATGEKTFSRESVLRVSTRGPSHAGRKALIGTGIGAAVGAATIAGICQTSSCKGPVEAIVGVTIGAPLGALVGFVMPTGGWHDVYRAR
jgi:hypothetical protein